MKYLSTRFEDYINECKGKNFHKEILNVSEYFSSNLSEQNNLIFYGPSGVGKYTQALNYIKKFSSTELRFERKINITCSKKEYIFKKCQKHPTNQKLTELDFQVAPLVRASSSPAEPVEGERCRASAGRHALGSMPRPLRSVRTLARATGKNLQVEKRTGPLS